MKESVMDMHVSTVTRGAPFAAELSDGEQDWFRTHLAHWLGSGAVTPLAPMSRPYPASARRTELSRSRGKEVSGFFRRCLDVYDAVLADELPPIVGKALYGDNPVSFGLEFHRGLGAAARTIPRSFRTDESISGKLYEVQVPGSGWGDYLLLSEFYDRQTGGKRATDTLTWYIDRLKEHCGTADPRIMYFVDSASSQVGARYFVQRSRELGLRYYGWDPDVGLRDVDFIKSHTWHSLWTDPQVTLHIKQAQTNPRLYDLTPNWIFWTKVMCALPSWRLTRDLFTDRDRDLFAYTAVLEPDGFQMPDGEFVSREQFLATKPSRRRFYLKYCGYDRGRNGGSRGVYRIDSSGEAVNKLINDAWDESVVGAPWILQQAVEDDLVDGVDDPRLASMHSKFSTLCAFEELYGSLLMLRKHYKVHGQADTMFATVDEGPSAAQRPEAL
jgi:hypothetical protein